VTLPALLNRAGTTAAQKRYSERIRFLSIQKMLDVGRAYARVFGPSPHLDDYTYASYISELLDAAQPRTGFEKVSTVKPPYALGSVIFGEARTDNAPSRASPTAPKVCTEQDQQTYSDASSVCRMTLGPPMYCYNSHKRQWYESKKVLPETSYSLAFKLFSFLVLSMVGLFSIVLVSILDSIVGATFRLL
jgi:hypothetical protein